MRTEDEYEDNFFIIKNIIFEARLFFTHVLNTFNL
jgi:hypothetical protein